MEKGESNSVNQEGVNPILEVERNIEASIAGILVLVVGMLGLIKTIIKRQKLDKKLPEEEETSQLKEKKKENEDFKEAINTKRSRIEDGFKEIYLKEEVLKILNSLIQVKPVSEAYEQKKEEEDMKSSIEKSKAKIDEDMKDIGDMVIAIDEDELEKTDMEIEVFKIISETADRVCKVVEDEINMIDQCIITLLKSSNKYAYEDILSIEELVDTLKREISKSDFAIGDILVDKSDTSIKWIEYRKKIEDKLKSIINKEELEGNKDEEVVNEKVEQELQKIFGFLDINAEIAETQDDLAHESISTEKGPHE